MFRVAANDFPEFWTMKRFYKDDRLRVLHSSKIFCFQSKRPKKSMESLKIKWTVTPDNCSLHTVLFHIQRTLYLFLCFSLELQVWLNFSIWIFTPPGNIILSGIKWQSSPWSQKSSSVLDTKLLENIRQKKWSKCIFV